MVEPTKEQLEERIRRRLREEAPTNHTSPHGDESWAPMVTYRTIARVMAEELERLRKELIQDRYPAADGVGHERALEVLSALCPSCGASPGKLCVSRTGRAIQPLQSHVARFRTAEL
jgi:hypothetical protein